MRRVRQVIALILSVLMLLGPWPMGLLGAEGVENALSQSLPCCPKKAEAHPDDGAHDSPTTADCCSLVGGICRCITLSVYAPLGDAQDASALPDRMVRAPVAAGVTHRHLVAPDQHVPWLALPPPTPPPIA